MSEKEIKKINESGEERVSGGVDTKADVKSDESSLAPKKPAKPGRVPKPWLTPKRYGAPFIAPSRDQLIKIVQSLEENK